MVIKKLRWVLLAVAILVAIGLASYRQLHEYYVKANLDPQLELQESLKTMTAVKSYRYSLKSTFTVDGRREVISEVQGEKDNYDTHIKGEMVNTPVDIYYLDSTIYNYDSFSKKWLVIESNTHNSEELLISELNPLSNFRFKSIRNVKKLYFDQIGDEEYLVVSCNPSIESQLLETMWKDFEYKLWIEYKQNYIKKASLTATNKQNQKTKLEIKVDIFDIGKRIDIKPPDLGAAKKS
ncbi:MAG: hypothetical protein ACOX6I_10080 [Syntrophomonadaceae bacterium]|jgi:hypothetical protein